MANVEDVDLLIIGGGINGSGIARDAAGRGLRTLLCEQHDLANHTSAASSKLIHGGLRYLEHYAFSLVRKSLIERELLFQAAPHLIRPQRFVLPHDNSLRPEWLIRTGLFIYDHLVLGKSRFFSGSQHVRLDEHRSGDSLRSEYTTAFVYSDALVDDSRLVVLNAIDAAERGAEILTRTRCVSVWREQNSWTARLKSEIDGTVREVRARCLVNAAGPWVSSFLEGATRQPPIDELRLIKGSHIIVPKLFDDNYAYILQNSDNRIVFALPYEKHFTLVGTTELEYQADPAEVSIEDEEIEYLCEATNRYFKRQLTAQDVVWAYSGVRPLLAEKSGDASSVTRDYKLDLRSDGAPIINVIGGKITTFRKLAEEVIDMLQPVLRFDVPAWTGRNAPLPGGDIANSDFDEFLQQLRQRNSWLPAELILRYARAYGSRTEKLLDGARQLEDLGTYIGDGIYAAELSFLTRHEFAYTSEDILWRRSKLGLHVSSQTVQRLEKWLCGTLRDNTANSSKQISVDIAMRCGTTQAAEC